MAPTMYKTKSLRIEVRTKEKGHLGRPHCHVVGPGVEASIDLNTCEVLASKGFSVKALREVVQFVKERREQLLETWNDYHA
jgi:hypothetical protein